MSKTTPPKSPAKATKHKTYTMTISRMTVDKLGVKLYDRVSAVIAEMIANSYDADATRVEIRAPMGELLAANREGKITDLGYVIEVIDNGVGMTPDEINDFYLRVGAERRRDARRGDRSRIFKRKVMGRKGVGKLAPFGVCQKIEIISAGGEVVAGIDHEGKAAKGYLTAHLTMDRTSIMSDTDEDYEPTPGPLDETVRPATGTTLRLTTFDHRFVPTLEDFGRQLSQRFGVVSKDWEIILSDTGKAPSSATVGAFGVETMPETRLTLSATTPGSTKAEDNKVLGENGVAIVGVQAGFEHEGRFYPVTGWIGYARKPYKDDLMAGVRIYCRGKIAAQSHIFNLRAGFTGEYDIRSYLVGELHVDWLDEEEDLIRTDRQDILWSHSLGKAFEAWGQQLVKQVGKISREPARKKAWDAFREISKIEEKVEKAFPGDEKAVMRARTMDIAKAIASRAREDELLEPGQADKLVQLSLLLGPHITLDEKLREAAASEENSLSVITSILQVARIAELSAFGKIADDRVSVIKTVEKLKDDPATREEACQQLIETAPWLVNSQWAPVTANETFTTLKKEFEKHYKQETGKDLVLADFSTPGKRADFVMSNQNDVVEIIEIKRPGHKLTNDEMDRIQTYITLMNDFLGKKGHEDFKRIFHTVHVTLVCDEVGLTGVHDTAFKKLQKDGELEHITWTVFLARTRRTHQDFLNEADRQRKVATKA